jgi:hypothetical protein
MHGFNLFNRLLYLYVKKHEKPFFPQSSMFKKILILFLFFSLFSSTFTPMWIDKTSDSVLAADKGSGIWKLQAVEEQDNRDECLCELTITGSKVEWK